MSSESNDEPGLASRPLDPVPAPKRTWLKYVLLLWAVSVAGAMWLAVRLDSPDYARTALDALVQVGGGAVFALAGYRLLVLYPFRIAELVAMVVVLGVGVQVTVKALESFSQTELFVDGPITSQEQLGKVLMWCLVVSSFLLAGGALGLRYCNRLKIEGTFSRVWAVCCGMLSLPAAAGSLGFGALCLADVFGTDQPSQYTEWYLLLWIASLIVTGCNALYVIRSMALQSEVESQKG